MPEISIIVPIYKVEKYINRCVDSILNQKFKDFELILVDDGSPDNCGKICDEYAKNDSRVVSVHKKNGGLSDARNYGINIAKGEYVGFVDSDDYIADDMYETLYNNIIKYDADVSVCGLYNCYNNNQYPEYDKNELLILNNKEALKMVLEGQKFSVPACNKLYKKELFNNIKYPVGRLSEDAFVTPKLLASTNRTVVDTTAKYYYVHRKDSITCSKFKKKDFDVVDAYKGNLEFVKEKYPEFTKQAEFRYIWSHMYVLDKMIADDEFSNIDEYKTVVSFLRKNIFKILSMPWFTSKRKLASIILLFSSNLYEKVSRKNNDRQKALFS